MLHGLIHLSFWGHVLVAFVSIQITYACITLYLHRSQAHRALDLHPIVSHFCRYWLWLTTSIVTKEWVAVHRKHHAKCETKEDPHSPKILGINKVLWGGWLLYRNETKNQETLNRYGDGTPDDWMEQNLYSRYSTVGVFLLLGIDLLLFGVAGFAIWIAQMVATPLGAAGVINGIGHFWGYRNFECSDAARNIVPWGMLFAGEELHNNHHTFGTSAKLSVKWWEFDIGWLYICILRQFGLARPKKIPAKLVESSDKSQVDLETLKTVIGQRFQVLTQYGRTVVLPVLREEREKASVAGRTLLRKAKRLLVRSDSLLDENSKQQINNALEQHHTLRLVYQYRQKLQAIWNRTTTNHHELLEALQLWCKEAEETGVNALRKFAARLKKFSVTS
jgi:stearoyl-CoA desaturase (delta-9 desaturase)